MLSVVVNWGRMQAVSGSMDKTMNRLHRVGGFKGVDVDENTLVETNDEDLAGMRKSMKEVPPKS